MATKGKSIVDDVLAQIPAPRAQSWDQRIDPEHVDTLREIREAWLTGRLGTKRITAARAIAKTLNAKGIAKVGPQGVLAWLERA
jgi:hypothetical protein